MKTMQKTFFALGTANTVMASYEDTFEDKVTSAFQLIKQKVEDMDDRFSVFKPDSEISRINAQAGKGNVQVSEDTYLIICSAVKFAKLSEGAFDITTRPVSKLWGIGKKETFIPSTREIKKAVKLVNYKDISLEEAPYRVGLKRKGQEMDLGGIAKGFAADEAKRILMEQGIENAVIDFGGTVIVIGELATVGIQNPAKETKTPMGTLEIANKAIVTSGSYERYFIKDGIRYHHLINPQTGTPAWNNLAGITLVGDSAMELDALTTAVFVLGIEAGNKLMQKMNLEGVFICETGEVLVTKGLKTKFMLLPKEEKYHG
jgi:thiamine biosynthesis lipoprotein